MLRLRLVGSWHPHRHMLHKRLRDRGAAQYESLHLRKILEQELPREHVMYDHVSRAVDTVQANANWSWAHKESYLTRLIARSKKLANA